MLVITRSKGTEFYIGDDIVVRILDAHGQVRIGIEAPRDVQILRDNAKKDK